MFRPICSSAQRVYSLRGVQRRCVWAVGRLGVAACVAAAAVDRQARQSCLVWCDGVNISFKLYTHPGKCDLFKFSSFVVFICLRCFDAVGWAAGRASGL